jgi:hypothetical protein
VASYKVSTSDKEETTTEHQQNIKQGRLFNKNNINNNKYDHQEVRKLIYIFL